MKSRIVERRNPAFRAASSNFSLDIPGLRRARSRRTSLKVAVSRWGIPSLMPYLAVAYPRLEGLHFDPRKLSFLHGPDDLNAGVNCTLHSRGTTILRAGILSFVMDYQNGVHQSRTSETGLGNAW